MFSRAAKSVVKNFGQRKCYVSDENIKMRVIGAAEEIGQTLSQYAKTGPKLNGSSISNSRPNSNLLMISAEKSQSLKASQAQKVQDPRTESFPQKNNSAVSYFANRELDLDRAVTELRNKEIKLCSKSGLKKQAETSTQQQITDVPLSEEKVGGQMWALTGIPAVQHDSSASQWRQLGQTRSEGLPSYTAVTTQPRNAAMRISRIPKVMSEAMIAEKLWLGDPDCGEGLPDRPQRSPCHPPDGPCVPMKKPGYPAKPKPAKKDFCFNCPPKRPCNLNKCPPDSCDGTCGIADFGRRNLLKLNSESQARSDMQSTVDSETVKFCDSSTWTCNQPDHIQVNNLQGVQQQFCLSSDGSKPTKKIPPDPSSHPIFPELQSPESVTEAKELYHKYPPLRQLRRLTECPKLLEVKPICPSLTKLTKCPECPKLVERKADEVFVNACELKSQSLSPSIGEKATKKSASNLDCDASKSYANQPSASKASSALEGQVTKFLTTTTWNGNRPPHIQPNNLCGVQRQFCSSSHGSKSPKKKPKETKCSDKPKPIKPPSRPTPPKTPETVKEPKVLYQKCPPLPKLPKLPECPKVLEVTPKCPPVPKLPKCPECPKPAKPKANPEKVTKKSASSSDCHSDKSDSASKGSSTIKHASEPIDYPKGSYCCSTVPEKVDKKTTKKKGLWDKIRDATKREMSTFALKNPNLYKAPTPKNKKRHLWTSSISGSSFSSKTDPPSSDSYPPWKSRKCKTVEEVCGEVVDPKLKALECKPAFCPKTHHTTCYPEKPRCAEVKEPPKKKSEKDKIIAQKTSDYCGESKDNYRLPTIVKPVEKIQYKKTECVETKLLKAGPCPPPVMSLTAGKDETVCKASSHPLPKPPAPPVHLCLCTPPPKLHPGSCPCYENNESTAHILTEPCPKKTKHSCPASPVYYCPPMKDCEKKDKVCQDNKKTTKP